MEREIIKTMFIDLDSMEVGPISVLMAAYGVGAGMRIIEVKQTESFQDLVKYGEWMPVEGEEK